MLQGNTTVSLITFDAEQLNDAVANFGDYEHVQLTDGPFRGQVTRSHFGASILDTTLVSQHVLVKGSYPPDRITLAFIISAREAGYYNGMRFAVNDTIIIAEEGAIEAYRMPAGTQLVGLQTRRDLLEREGIALPARSRTACYSRLCPEAMQLGRSLKALITPPSGPRMTSTHSVAGQGMALEDELIAGFRRAIDASRDNDLRAYRARHQHRASLLRKFEEVVQHHLSRELRIPDLCASIGISQRTLENLCNDYYGMPPRRYLKTRRLNAVRHRLLHAAAEGESIAAIAARFGFRHAGRFSQIYRSLFSEFPSKTLAGRDA